MSKKYCRECGTLLIVGENVTQHGIDTSRYICNPCARRYLREWYHRTGRGQSMNENRECTSFLGISVAEQVLYHVFKNVQRMPVNNPGYDFICGGGYMIDIKSACRRHPKRGADFWNFHIGKNQIAEYFLCLAFDNREDLNPEYVWLIPGGDVNDHVSVSIAESQLSKWDEYRLDINKVITCCNTIKNVHAQSKNTEKE